MALEGERLLGLLRAFAQPKALQHGSKIITQSALNALADGAL